MGACCPFRVGGTAAGRDMLRDLEGYATRFVLRHTGKQQQEQ